MPDRQKLSRQFRHWGINNSTQLVCYDDVGGTMAARFWWLARWLGLARVALLDGGIQAWIQAGLEVESGETALPAKGTFSEGKPLTRQTSATSLLALIHAAVPAPLLIDARSQARYDGETEPLDTLAGHIPGALCLPCAGNLQDTGFFKSETALQHRFEAILTPGAQAICYCGSGVTASHNILALKIAGYPEATLYPGSWSEWIEDEQRPVLPPRAPTLPSDSL